MAAEVTRTLDVLRASAGASAMRIDATVATGFASPAGGARRAAARGTFSVAGDAAAPSVSSTTAPRSLGGIDALLALQAVDALADKRRRAVRRGRTALEVLDELNLGVLAGALDTATLGKLKTAVATLAEDTGDSRLDTVLAEINLRAEVELAKFAPRQAQASI